tara:strand:+ start:285 stop:713 length:429 start_codon:yes stop_codon:yes gene_type:complete
MPTYKGICAEHGEQKFFLTMRGYMEDGLKCGHCGKEARTVIQPVRTIGPSSDHPLVLDQIGKTFTSKSEADAYFKAHPGRAIVAKNDTEFVKLRDHAREKAETKAQAQGFRDLAAKRSHAKKEENIKKQISVGNGKIQVSTT